MDLHVTFRLGLPSCAQWLTITGSNFGADSSVVMRVSYGPTGTEFVARNCTIVVPHTTLECLTPPGVGIGLGFSVVVDKQESSAPRTSYNPPSNISISNLLAGYSTRVRLRCCHGLRWSLVFLV